MIYIEAILRSLLKAFEFSSNQGKRLALDFHDTREVEFAELKKHNMLASKSESQHLKLVFDPGDGRQLMPALIWVIPAGPFTPEMHYCRRNQRAYIPASFFSSNVPMGHVNWQKIQRQTRVKADILRDIYLMQSKLLKMLAEYKRLFEELSGNKVDFEGFRFDFLPENYMADKKAKS